MNKHTIETAAAEAKRFLERVNALQAVNKSNNEWEQPKERGAVRRASMDLTRALAELRKPG
jgi:hypothetical protein